jgi:hypothetical protein
MLQFIAQNKKTGRVKVIHDISSFSEEEFTDFNVYSTQKIEGTDFDNFKKQLQIRALQDQSKAILEQQREIANQLSELTGGQVTPPPPMMNPNSRPMPNGDTNILPEIPEGASTAIMNTRTNALFTKDELWEEFAKFKEVVERKIPEVEMVEFNEKEGFTCIVTEIVPNIPKVLPLGIPIKQRIES